MTSLERPAYGRICRCFTREERRAPQRFQEQYREGKNNLLTQVGTQILHRGKEFTISNTGFFEKLQEVALGVVVDVELLCFYSGRVILIGSSLFPPRRHNT